MVTLLPPGNVTSNSADYFGKPLKKGKRNLQSSQMPMNPDAFPSEERNFFEEALKIFCEIGKNRFNDP